MYSVITGTGKYLPTRKITNDFFLNKEFYNADGEKITKANEDIIKKFEEITNIKERRYVKDDLASSDIAYLAAKEALKSSCVDPESLDYIIVAHNFGDVQENNRRSDIVPSLASRVKYLLGITNHKTIPYDLPFGCPGWVQGMIQADYYIKAGHAKKIMVIGAETLSRIADPHDIDCMLYADGAGAAILQATESEKPIGILSHCTRSDTKKEAYMLKMDKSYNPNYKGGQLFLKMQGHHLYEYALKTVPSVVKKSMERAGIRVRDVKKVLIHQANEKMDLAILKRLFKLCGEKTIPEGVMPMIISKFGNSSVATVPTLLDMFLKEELKGHTHKSGDNIILTSVGAGMNINSIVYKMP